MEFKNQSKKQNQKKVTQRLNIRKSRSSDESSERWTYYSHYSLTLDKINNVVDREVE